MSSAPILGWVESCLPGVGGLPPRERANRVVSVARANDLALELEVRHDAVLEPFEAPDVEVAALQAWDLHSWNALSPEPEDRARARDHVRLVIDAAGRVGCKRVVTVVAYGESAQNDRLELAIEFYQTLAEPAAAAGVRLLIEPLSPLRADAFTTPEEAHALLAALARPDVFGLLLDTGHLMDQGRDPAEVLRACRDPVEQLQLRGPGSMPPSTDAPFREWVDCARGLQVVTVEHRQQTDEEQFLRLLRTIRAALA